MVSINKLIINYFNLNLIKEYYAILRSKNTDIRMVLTIDNSKLSNRLFPVYSDYVNYKLKKIFLIISEHNIL